MITQLCQYHLFVYISYLNLLSLTVIHDIVANYDVCLLTFSKDNFNIHEVENNGRNNVLLYFFCFFSHGFSFLNNL